MSKIVLITGAAKRVGRELALHFAAAGWDVALHYGQSGTEAQLLAAQIMAMGRRVIALQADLAQEDQVRALLPQCIAALGVPNCIINNASRFEFDSAVDIDYTRLTAHILPNLAAPLLLAQALHAAVPTGRQACVINLLDQKLYNLNPDFLSYSLSKIALEGATKMLAQALAPTVRVVGLAPGLTLPSYLQTTEQFTHTHQLTPLGQSSTPEDLAQAALFLASSPAITGTTLVVDGGQHLQPLSRDISFYPTEQ
ncbi:SDR family oxidoreductase [Parvibium lacunae]|nr:SDR family oxidoreductase [Parvibium lacunae]